MSIQNFSFCVSLCVLLSASYGFAGGKHSAETRPEPPDNWVQKGYEFEHIFRKSVSLPSNKKTVGKIEVAGFIEDSIVTKQNRVIKLSDLMESWARVDRQHPSYNAQLWDPEKRRIGTAHGIYSNGDFLLVAKVGFFEYAWRAAFAEPMSDTPPNNGRKTHTNYDTRASETRVDLSTVATKADCADSALCDEHRCDMKALGCGHFRCEECFPLEDPLACVSCLADSIGTVQKPT